jgi:hypothetical protein
VGFGHCAGLHPLHKIDGAKHQSAYRTNGNKGIEELRIQSSGGSLLTSAHFRPSLRYLLCGLEKQMMLPAVVFFFRPENCNVGLKDATEVGLSFEEYCVDLKVLLCLVLSL